MPEATLPLISPLRVVALAASAGGLAALSVVLRGLSGQFPAAVTIVQHLQPAHRSRLSEILGERTALRVQQAAHGDRLQPATAYVAPPDWHLLVMPGGQITLAQSPAVHYVRPAADVLFHSLAISYGAQAIAVVLTGTGKDGAAGAQAIRAAGGVVIAQDQATAEFFSMPEAAIKTRSVNFVLPLDKIALTLTHLVGG